MLTVGGTDTTMKIEYLDEFDPQKHVIVKISTGRRPWLRFWKRGQWNRDFDYIESIRKKIPEENFAGCTRSYYGASLLLGVPIA